MSTRISDHTGQIVYRGEGDVGGGSVTTHPETGQMVHNPKGGGGVWNSTKAAEMEPDPVMKTIRRPTGGFVRGSYVTPDCLVTVMGVQMPVRDAEARGFLTRDGNGIYRTAQQAAGPVGKADGPARVAAADGTEPNHPQQAAQQEAPQERLRIPGEGTSDPEGQERLEEALEADLGAIKEMVPQSTVARAVLEVAREGGTISPDAIKRAAHELGETPEVVAERVEAIRAGFEDQARATVEGVGMDADEVFAWAWKEKPKEMRRAIQDHVHGRSTQAYQELARTYLENLDTINPQMILDGIPDQGVTVQRSQATGGLVLVTPFGTIGWKQAVRQGIISPYIERG